MSFGNIVFCKSCIYAKATWKLVVKVWEWEWATELRGKVHTDLWGPAPVTTIKGCRYYISFTDDKTWLTHLYLLKYKSNTLHVCKEYKASLTTQHNAAVCTLHSDHGGEYTGRSLFSISNGRACDRNLLSMTPHSTMESLSD